MSPMMHKIITDNANQIPPERESSHQTEGAASWSKWDVNTFPPELLSHIFSSLECEDIARVRGTCKRFREVVEANRYEAFFYLRLPRAFRKQYPQSLSWQKWLINNHLHPFSTVVPEKINRCLNTEQQAAMLCFETLREMMSAPWYQSVEVFSYPLPKRYLQLEFSLTSSNLLFYEVSGRKLHLSGQNEAGSWSEQLVDPVTLPGARLSAALGLKNNECWMTISSSDNIIENFARQSHGTAWTFDSRSSTEVVNDYRFSSPGKYSAISFGKKGFDSIRCFDDQGQWVPMPIAKNAGIDDSVSEVRFSPSEQHAAMIFANKLVILSLDDQGCWNFSVEIPVDAFVTVETKNYWISYVDFCSSGDWLVTSVKGLDSSGSTLSAVIMLRFDLQWQYFQTISYDSKKLFFSSTGRYLVQRDVGQLHVLYELHESGEWLPYHHSPPPTTLPLLKTGQEQYTIALSPCDNYQCTSTSSGLVIIWGRDKKGGWKSLGSKKFDRRVTLCQFSQSGVHALTVGHSSIYIWRRSEDGCWFVKGTIPATGVRGAYFHQIAEHLIIFWNSEKLRFWEIRKEDQEAVVVS